MGVLLLVGCAGGRTTTQQWCDDHLVAVAASGTQQGSHFDFGGSRPAIEWADFAADSGMERSIVIGESTNGADIFDAACNDAFTKK